MSKNRLITVSLQNDSIIKKGIKDLMNELVSENLNESKRKEILEKYAWLNDLILK